IHIQQYSAPWTGPEHQISCRRRMLTRQRPCVFWQARASLIQKQTFPQESARYFASSGFVSAKEKDTLGSSQRTEGKSGAPRQSCMELRRHFQAHWNRHAETTRRKPSHTFQSEYTSFNLTHHTAP